MVCVWSIYHGDVRLLEEEHCGTVSTHVSTLVLFALRPCIDALGSAGCVENISKPFVSNGQPYILEVFTNSASE